MLRVGKRSHIARVSCVRRLCSGSRRVLARKYQIVESIKFAIRALVITCEHVTRLVQIGHLWPSLRVHPCLLPYASYHMPRTICYTICLVPYASYHVPRTISIYRVLRTCMLQAGKRRLRICPLSKANWIVSRRELHITV